MTRKLKILIYGWIVQSAESSQDWDMAARWRKKVEQLAWTETDTPWSCRVWRRVFGK